MSSHVFSVLASRSVARTARFLGKDPILARNVGDVFVFLEKRLSCNRKFEIHSSAPPSSDPLLPWGDGTAASCVLPGRDGFQAEILRSILHYLTPLKEVCTFLEDGKRAV